MTNIQKAIKILEKLHVTCKPIKDDSSILDTDMGLFMFVKGACVLSDNNANLYALKYDTRFDRVIFRDFCLKHLMENALK